ncbi:MAG: DNA polymerase III subunit beta [Cellvibrionales bacterium]|nr:DNA polymerase III subunit beta [Cellvibrionales bacterium]
MKFSIDRDILINGLSVVAGVVEKKQTMAVLANVLFEINGADLTITGTDTEVQMSVRVLLETPIQGALRTTIPAKKLLDIAKSLPEKQLIEFIAEDETKLILRCGKSRFSLATISASDFPSVDKGHDVASFALSQQALKRLIDKTSFAMAQQDVRFYLNGMLWELEDEVLNCIATDGHRLALSSSDPLQQLQAKQPKSQIIVPRKAVLELSRTLSQSEDQVEVFFGANHLYIKNSYFTFVTSLIDGKYPDYKRVLPTDLGRVILGSRQELKDTFNRAAILSNEKYRGIQVMLSPNQMTIQATNPEREEAEDSVVVDYQGDSVEIGFNVSYLIDVMSILQDDQVKISLSSANSSALIHSSESQKAMYVVMPMCL